MITGFHAILYASDAGAARRFFRDVLGLPSVDAGQGWLIFGLPPAELAAHPVYSEKDEAGRHEMYLMCDNINATVEKLKAKGVEFTSPIADRGWGILTSFRIPGGGEISLYQPKHPRPAPMKTDRSTPGRRAAARGAKRSKPRPPKGKPPPGGKGGGRRGGGR